MIRYVAFIWTDEREAAEHLKRRFFASHAEWTTAFDADGLTIYVISTESSIDRVYPLAGQRGLVIGKLFENPRDRGEAASMVRFDDASSSRLVEEDGAPLIQNYWGRYVAFLRFRGERRTSILRDPTGGIHCLMARWHGVDIVFSRLSDCASVAPLDLSVDWQYVRSQLVYGDLPKQSTGLREISQLQPGECLRIEPDVRTRSFRWNPMRVACDHPIEDAEDAISSLRTTIRACVRAWASCHRRILLLLSGGLDSSIVLACLRDAPSRPSIVALNHFSQGADTDERSFARLAAERTGCELIEWTRNSRSSWKPLLNVPRTPFMSSVIGDIDTGRTLASFARERGITAKLSGSGGDLLFYRHHGWLAAADHAYRRPFGRGLLATALTAAQLDRTTIWSTLKHALWYGLLRQPWPVLPDVARFRTLLPEWVLESAKSDPTNVHPLYRGTRGVAPGKVYQAHTTTYALSPYYNPFGQPSDPDYIAPLLSQPVVELCLRIPLYLHMCDGQDRVIARRAFEQELPPEIVWRQSKGGVEEHVKDALFSNIDVVRGLLLDGVLAQEKLIDVDKVALVLSRGPSRIASSTAEIYSYINAEAWLRSWCGVRHSAAA